MLGTDFGIETRLDSDRQTSAARFLRLFLIGRQFFQGADSKGRVPATAIQTIENSVGGWWAVGKLAGQKNEIPDDLVLLFGNGQSL